MTPQVRSTTPSPYQSSFKKHGLLSPNEARRSALISDHVVTSKAVEAPVYVMTFSLIILAMVRDPVGQQQQQQQQGGGGGGEGQLLPPQQRHEGCQQNSSNSASGGGSGGQAGRPATITVAVAAFI